MIGAYGPFPVLGRRRREAALAAFADAADAPLVAWTHRIWVEVLGDAPLDAAFRSVADYAVRSGDAGRPTGLDAMDEVLAGPLARAARGAVALAAFAVLAEQARADLLRRLTGRKRFSLTAIARDAVSFSVGAPVLAPLAGWAAMGWAMAQAAPDLPAVDIDRPADASLLAHVVADAVPAYLGGALARIAVVRSPLAVAVAVRSGRQGVTVRLGRGALSVVDGVSPDVVAVLDGEIDELLQTVGDALITELSRVPEPEGPKD